MPGGRGWGGKEREAVSRYGEGVEVLNENTHGRRKIGVSDIMLNNKSLL